MRLRNKESYPEVCLRILEKLGSDLPQYLTYHTLEHTIDVANVCEEYIQFYDLDKESSRLLRIAAVGHDFGYIWGPEEHEERGITELTPLLRSELRKDEIDAIFGMIRATKIPQQPEGLLEKIMADADLDYLGRGDYWTVSDRLHEEFKYFGMVDDEADWLRTQIRFLEAHNYHTEWALKHRSNQKEEVLRRLKEQLN